MNTGIDPNTHRTIRNLGAEGLIALGRDLRPGLLRDIVLKELASRYGTHSTEYRMATEDA